MGLDFDGDGYASFLDADRNSIRLRGNTLYRHGTARINYTTYDLHRDFDTINPHTHPFIMVSSPEVQSNPTAHPFWYAAVLGIFHADVQHTGTHSRSLTWQSTEFLWVRWLGVVPNHVFGRQQVKLPQVGFVPDTDEYAFGFLDPSLVIRGCHLIPSFVDGRTKKLLRIVSGKGRQNPQGRAKGRRRVRVRVAVLLPSKNPHPHGGYGGFGHETGQDW